MGCRSLTIRHCRSMFESGFEAGFESGQVAERLITRNLRIDFAGPGVNAARDGLRGLKSLLAEPVRDAQGTGSVMAEDEQAVVGIKFLMCARRNIAHGHQQATIDLCGCVLPGFANVDQLCFAFPEQDGSVPNG